MATVQTLRMTNGAAVNRDDIPVLAWDEFREELLQQIADGGRVAALFGLPKDDEIELHAVVGHAETAELSIFTTTVGDRYPSLTPDCPQVHWFEREIAEQWGVVPEDHPWLKPIRFHHSRRPGKDAWGRAVGDTILPCVTNFYRVEGPEIHEVAVGPVHAGVIEPGHFRFQCHGEHVFHLEISLGYQHRGIEDQLVGGPTKRTIHYMETAAGDTSIGHATAYCQAIEGLAGVEPTTRAHVIRAIGLELERLANHTGDLGALAGDVGFLPTMSYCGRLRGDFLNLSAVLCGSRFGRGLVRPGGVGFDLERTRIRQASERLADAFEGVSGAAQLLWDAPTVQARFEDTGRVSLECCQALGLVGPAARACGAASDTRRDFPSGAYRVLAPALALGGTGDVHARALVRWREIKNSVAFVQQQLESPALHGASATRVAVGPLRPNALAVSLVEGWRGEICHVARTDAEGRFDGYKMVDPSFHNWIGLAMSLRDQQISDFPLCNKSFNLSYCGHDL